MRVEPPILELWREQKSSLRSLELWPNKSGNLRLPVKIGAAAIADSELIVEEHPLFPEWFSAFEHLVKAHARVKAAGAGALLDLQKELTSAKAAYLSLANELD